MRNETDERFVNPYNFIPLVGGCRRSKPVIKKDDSYTGYFDCRLRLVTPLFIPNTSSSNGGYDFFSYENLQGKSQDEWTSKPPKEPVIPGSEIRGAVRSVYEAAFGGCLSSVSTDGKNRRPPDGYEPCFKDELCPACQIFGMVGKQKERYAYGSRIRITDARLCDPVKEKETLFEEPVILPALGEPHPEKVEFYTFSPYAPGEATGKGKGYWTYEDKYIYGEKDKKQTGNKPLEEGKLKIRGRKYYWHGSPDLSKYPGGGNKKVSVMRQRIRPMKANDRELFQFRVYFERLSKDQISELKWALDFNDEKCAHKIGRAKPLGFGSVRLRVEGVYLRTISGETGQWELEAVDTANFLSAPFADDEARGSLRIMAGNFELAKLVKYPLGKGRDGSSASWFTLNKKWDADPVPNFKKLLPDARTEAKNSSSEHLYKLIKNKPPGKPNSHHNGSYH